jgi:DNA polymerase-3 subunit epsilon
MNIHLNKPLVFFDLEATGLTIGLDRIVEICILKVETDNSTEIKTWRINPEMPIPEKVSKLHGIYDKDIADCPTIREAAPQIVQFIGNADLAGFNSNKYDVPMLVEELLRADVDFDLKNRRLIDVQNIFHVMEPRNLSAAYKFYCDKILENAHTAEADTIATYEILKAQLERYKDSELKDENGNAYKPVVNDVTKLSEITTSKNRFADLAGRIVYNEQGAEVFNFGKHKDKAVTEVFQKEPSYYNWMMNGDFPLYTKKILTQIRLSMLKK